MKKRGIISLWFLIELIVAFLVGYMAFDLSVTYTQKTIYEKLNIAKDLAMQINTLSGVSGDAYIINNNLHGYSIHFYDNKVEVLKDNFDQSKGTYYFTKIGSSKLDVKFDKPTRIVIAKINNDIKILENPPVLI